MKHLVIIGGGIAGLSTAYYAQKAARTQGFDLRITIIEKAPRLGGKIMTDSPAGFVIEGGPDSFITQKPWALQLCRELGLDDKMIGTNDDRRAIYILKDGRLLPMPDGLMLVVPTRFLPFALSSVISWRGKLRMAMDWFIKPRQDDSDESLADFMRRRLGNEALEVLGEPMMAGIHVADAETLSLKATFPRFIDIERKYGSLIRGMLAGMKNRPPSKNPLFMTLKGGLSTLVSALEDALDVEMLTGVGVQSISQNQDGGKVIHTDDGAIIEADAVIMATPAYATAEMLRDVPESLTDLLKSIRYVSTATVSLGYRADEFAHPLNGFGFIIPKTEPTSLLACTWTSTKFDHRAPEDQVLLRCFIGGARQSELVNLDDETLLNTIQEELKRILKVNAVPTVSRIFRWHKANPQYDVGHLEKVDQIEALMPDGIYVTGSAFRGVGLPDCIHQGKQTAERVVQDLSTSTETELVAASI